VAAGLWFVCALNLMALGSYSIGVFLDFNFK